METVRKEAAKRGFHDLEDIYSAKYSFLHQGTVDILWEDLLHGEKDTTPDFTRWRNRMSVALVPKQAKKVLEIGIGAGHALEFLVKRIPGVQLYGTDISEEAVKRASRRSNGRFAVAEFGKLPWSDVKFDVVMMLEVLEHVEATRTLQLLCWIRSLLEANGRFILSVPLESVSDLRQSYFPCPHCGEQVHRIGHVRSYSELQPIQAELEFSGFEIETMLGLAGGTYLGIRRQWLMPFFPNRVKPMVMIFRCRHRSRI